MNTIMVWLLVSLPIYNGSYGTNPHPITVERFATLEECQRVSKIIRDISNSTSHKGMCIQASIVR